MASGSRPGSKTTAKTRTGKRRSALKRGVSPRQRGKVTPLRAEGRQIFRIRRENFLNLLSELLVLQKSGLTLCSLARDRAKSSDLRARLDALVKDSEKASGALQMLVRDLGGNPVYVSTGALLLEQRSRSFLDLQASSLDQTVADIENILANESLKQVYWTFLKSIVPHLDDVRARELLSRASFESETRELEHLLWAQQALAALLLQRALRPVEEEEEEAA